jgi:hypothetical protein
MERLETFEKRLCDYKGALHKAERRETLKTVEREKSATYQQIFWKSFFL